MMVKRKIYFRNPISRQNFANAFAETPNLNVEVCHRTLDKSFFLAEHHFTCTKNLAKHVEENSSGRVNVKRREQTDALPFNRGTSYWEELARLAGGSLQLGL